MKLKGEKYQDFGSTRPSDVWKVLARQMLLENLIPKTVAEALEDFTIELQIGDRSPATITFYHENLKSFIAFVSSDFQVNAITTSQLRQYFVSMDPDHVHARHCHYRALRALLNWCVKQNYLLSNPLTFSPPKLPELTIPAFSAAEIKAMVKACSQGKTQKLRKRDEAIILTLVDTGVRVGEMERLKLKDIDLRARVIEVSGKGKKKRLMKLSTPTVKAIWEYLKETEKIRKCDSLWLSEEGTSLGISGLKHGIKKVINNAGIAGHKASPHVFRHTFANTVLDSGEADLLDLQYMLGHSSLKMVERYSRAHKQQRALKAQERVSPVDRLGLK